MTDRTEKNNQTIVDWAGDIVALVSHIEEALDHQLKLDTSSSSVGSVIRELHDSVKADKDRALAFQKSTGTTPGNPVIKAGSELLGKAAGVIDRMRNDSVAKALRDDYTAINHLTVAYTMLHTTAMALKNQAAQNFAEQGMRNGATLVQKINNALPQAVLDDLVANGDVAVLDASIADECRAEIDRIWSETSENA